MAKTRAPAGLYIKVPGGRTLSLRHLVLDFNGTLACDGKLLAGVRPRLVRLSKALEVSVLTADTFGTARHELRSLPVTVHTVSTGAEKRRLVMSLWPPGVVAMGNGRNDVPMLRLAELGVAILGPEGTSAELLGAAAIVVRDIDDGLDLLLDLRRITATLRR